MGSETGPGVFKNGDYDQIQDCLSGRCLIFGLHFEADMLVMLYQPKGAPEDCHDGEEAPGKSKGLEELAKEME